LLLNPAGGSSGALGLVLTGDRRRETPLAGDDARGEQARQPEEKKRRERSAGQVTVNTAIRSS
jgi:hypothetical protein